MWEKGMHISRALMIVTLALCQIITLSPVIRTSSVISASAQPRITFFAMNGHYTSYLLINVSDYSGDTDTERIQKALNDVPAEGAIVFIPAGTWQASNLTAYSNTIVMGDNGTVLARPDNSTLPFVTFQNQTGFEIVNLIFDGRNITDATGILIENGTGFHISNSVFQNIARNAIRVIGISRDFLITDNSFHNSDGAPLILFGSPGMREIVNFTIANNTLTSGVSNGKIGVAFAADGLIADNHIVNCTYGIGTRNISNITISGNTIEQCADYGIYLGTQPGDEGSWNITIADNYITGSNTGIARYYGSGEVINITVRNNTIVNSIQSDIYADFQGFFVNNTLTSKDKVKLLTIPLQFTGNVDLNMTLTIPADVQGDGTVNMRDVGIVARLFQSSLGFDNWNPAADVIQNNVIDMKDISYVAKCFKP